MIRWMTLRSFADCLRLELLWVVLTLVFEWNFGRYVMGRSRESVAGVQLIPRGNAADWARHFCDDAVDCLAVTRGGCESLKEG